MSKEKSLVEDALIQMKNLEEAVAENAKGILASTMKEEISELVKESLSEQKDEEEIETDVEVDDDDDDNEFNDEFEDSDEEESDEEEFDDSDVNISMNTDNVMGSEETPIDLTKEKNLDNIIKVFKLMGPDDKLIIKKDDAGNINLKDEENDEEYMIVGESEEESFEDMTQMYEEDDMENEYDDSKKSEVDIDKIINTVFGDESDEIGEMDNLEEDDEALYEIDFDDEDDDMKYSNPSPDENPEFFGLGEEEEYSETTDDVVYEITMDEQDEEDEEDEYEEDEEEEEEFFESDDESLMESKKMKSKAKAKGIGMGKPKFSYDSKPNMSGGFKTVKKKSDKAMGTGNAKKVKIYKDDTNMDGKMKVVKGSKKMETKESSRTLGNGKYWGRKGLPKPKSSPRHIRLESTDNEVHVLREKNEEYRKALNVFRDKLNEVAVFNSNLAYATRLFTEHSTSKQEKINILKRFDSVESLKESKNLYKQIKDELGNKKSESLNESVDRVIQKAPSNGSSTSLIESKTYENPQFLRMKDLMSKLK